MLVTLLRRKSPGIYSLPPTYESDCKFIDVTLPEAMNMNEPKKTLLFVCVENSNRSQMAEAFARIHGGAGVEAYSAGSRPSGQINQNAVAAMSELNYDLSKHTSKSLNDIPDIEYDFVATMGCGDECPLIRAKKREAWDIPDPKHMEPDQFRSVRDLIEEKVKVVLKALAC